MRLAESVVLLQICNLFGILIGFKFLEAFNPKGDLFTMLFLNSREELAAISVCLTRPVKRLQQDEMWCDELFI